MERLYRVGEMAALTGVSVRTLHHYDQIGLLRPSARSEGGQRLYSELDALCLQQIITLRYLGFSLTQIGDVLSRPDFDMLASLRIQQSAMRERIADLERVEATLGKLIEHWTVTGRWAWELVVQVSAEIQRNLGMRGDSMQKYYTEAQMKQFEELGKQVSVEERLEIERQWATLIADVQANLSADPASYIVSLPNRPEAQALVERWSALIQATFRGNTELMKAVGENYRKGNFDHLSNVPSREVFSFIERASKAREAGGAG
ncbi:MAG: MerR family transcriptional regulator [Chloroflexi bacterium]|nr:MerR family transcriptional regulator [Chloroflexota bacterium]